MKYLISIFLSMLFFHSLTFAQDLKLVEVESNQIININADQSWAIVKDWKSLHKLVPKIVASTSVQGKGLASTWKISLVNGASITEKMVYYNSSEKTMSYIMTATPMPIEDYTAVIKVEPYGISKSLLSFYTSCQTATENFDKIKNTFKAFQETYLNNIEKQLP